MTNENTASVVPLRSPWREQLQGALTMVRQKLLLVGPYIKDDVITLLKQTLGARLENNSLEIRVITRTLPDDFISGASDLQALQHLLSWSDEFPGWSIEIRSINNVHAKIWVFDTDLAIIGSGNATFSGIERNVEYGVVISEPQLVEQILQDWQVWWEAAALVDISSLAAMQQWLDTINSDAGVRLAEELINKKRREVERRIGKAPQIGKRLPISQYSTNAWSNIIKDAPVSYDLASNDNLAPDLNITPMSAISPTEAIRVSSALLWQAICWCAPASSDEEIFLAETFLKLAWKTISPGTYALQCTWADGLRFSQAILPGSISSSAPSWAITLRHNEVKQLVDHMRQAQATSIENVSQISSDLLLWLQSSPNQLMVFFDSAEKHEPIGFSAVVSSMPGSFFALSKPHSRITVEERLLYDALTTFQQGWKQLHPTFPPPTTLELSFGSTGTGQTITLALGSIDDPLIRTISGTDLLMNGPEVRLRLDLAAFQRVIVSAHELIHRWQLFVGREAEAMQLMPEFNSDAAIDSRYLLLWKHELRNKSG